MLRRAPGGTERKKEGQEVIVMANRLPKNLPGKLGRPGKNAVATGFLSASKSFDDLVKRTTTKKTQVKAARRARELLGELLLCEVRQLTGKSQQQIADALGIKQPSLSK